MVNLKYIITGTGRCGTLFLANYLTSAGINCSHEAIFTFYGSEYAKDVINGNKEIIQSAISTFDNLAEGKTEILAESSYMAAPYLDEFKDCEIIHLIRHPKKVISSFMQFDYFSKPCPFDVESNPDHVLYEEFIFKNIPELKKTTNQLDRTALYWIEWNKLIESKKIDFTQNIESSLTELSIFIKSKGTYSNKKCNTNRPKKTWSVNEIESRSIKKELKEMSQKYGYLLCDKIF